MKILLHPKDHPWKTESGYSIAARYMIEYLKKHHDVAVYAPVGNKYSIDYYNGVPIYPGIKEDFGEDLVLQHYQDFKADLMIQLCDIWALSETPKLARDGKIVWVVQSPMDWLEPTPKHVLDRFRCAFKVVPWVQDTYKRLRQHGLENVAEPIPLGLNTKLWRPLDRSKFPNTMKSLGWAEDAFNILICGANQFLRKSWDETAHGIKLFKDAYPHVDVRIYAHAFAAIGEGWDLPKLFEFYNLQGKISDPYELVVGRYSEETMVRMFGLADCCINAGTEGFGYATIQANAVGTPVIGLNYAATPELLKSGILVPVGSTIMTPPLLRRAFPKPENIAVALETIHNSRRKRWRKGIRFVKEHFSWETIMPKWLKLLEEIETEFETKCLKIPIPSQELLEQAEKVIILD